MTEHAVTDEQLDAAAAELEPAVAAEELPEEEAIEEDVAVGTETDEGQELSAEEEAPDEELPPEPTDHGDRSQLGRKVGDLSRTVESVLERLDRIAREQERKLQEIPSYEYDPDEEIPMTRGELEKLLEERERRKTLIAQQDLTRYEKGYMEQFSTLAEKLQPEEAKAVEDTMMTKYNVRYSDDPYKDAELNFFKARTAVLENRPPAKPKPTLRESAPTGGASATTSSSRSAATVKLDPLAAEFVKKTGMKPEDVAKALEGEMPLNLVQGNINAR